MNPTKFPLTFICTWTMSTRVCALMLIHKYTLLSPLSTTNQTLYPLGPSRKVSTGDTLNHHVKMKDGG